MPAINLKYYKLSPPTISGTSGALCNNVQRTFSESAFTGIALDYNWNVSGELSEISDNDESSYTVEGSSQDGEGSVSLTVTTPSGATASTNKYVWVGEPENGLYPDCLIGPDCCEIGTNRNYFDGTPFPLIIGGAEYEWSIFPNDPGIYVYPIQARFRQGFLCIVTQHRAITLYL